MHQIANNLNNVETNIDKLIENKKNNASKTVNQDGNLMEQSI